MPVRGKILNCLKADFVRIFKSEIITDLIKVLGCGVEVRDKHTKDLADFDVDNLRWNKVIICTDADVDGYQIRTLILTMLYRLVPTLIKEGYVYIAESPLFEIECGARPGLPIPTGKRPTLWRASAGKMHHQPLQGPGRKRPGHDVAHHHEPRDPAAHQGDARGRRRMARGLRPAAGGQPGRTQGSYRFVRPCQTTRIPPRL
jgi:DNA gyrase subunit B